TEVLTHKAGAGSYRAPGAVAAHFAVESAVDELARRLGLDPLEMRLRNAAREGDLRPTNALWPRIGLIECLERMREHPLWRARTQNGSGMLDDRCRRLGIGLAVGGWPGGIEPAAATCRVEEDGTLTIAVGAIDLNGTHNGFRSIAAEAFGVDASKVRVLLGDSDSAPRSGATGGSKITLTVGAAVKEAVSDARRQTLAIAAEQLEAAVADLEIVEGRVQVNGAASHGLAIADIVRSTTAAASPHPPVYGRGASAISRNSPGFGAHVAQIAVDPLTGEIEVLRYVVAQDVGRAINPAEVEGQIYGGVVQGLGWALSERIVFDEGGHVLTGSLLDYALPRSIWAPNVEAILVEAPSPDGPFGAKGVGEPPIIPVAAAIANAVQDAVGIRLSELPMTPERVFVGIQAAAST
ncbi:MAG TPA: molybdopterin cofactor-binding domain-containing protein, partial [Thermomicrobiales bacterium]|nr:molybdopterin cofactor-binding domain-containing protein [Thermomicrobiales bacterium]